MLRPIAVLLLSLPLLAGCVDPGFYRETLVGSPQCLLEGDRCVPGGTGERWRCAASDLDGRIWVESSTYLGAAAELAQLGCEKASERPQTCSVVPADCGRVP